MRGLVSVLFIRIQRRYECHRLPINHDHILSAPLHHPPNPSSEVIEMRLTSLIVTTIRRLGSFSVRLGRLVRRTAETSQRVDHYQRGVSDPGVREVKP